MDLNSLFNAVAGAINNQSNQQGGVNTGDILNQVAGLFQQHADYTGQQINTGPYGNFGGGGYGNQGYGNQGYGNVLPASRDPLGDPADQQAGYGRVLPASMDPLGDPADG